MKNKVSITQVATEGIVERFIENMHSMCVCNLLGLIDPHFIDGINRLLFITNYNYFPKRLQYHSGTVNSLIDCFLFVCLFVTFDLINYAIFPCK